MMRCRGATAVLLLVLTFSLSVSMISLVRAEEDYWTSKTPMQQPRGGLGVAAVNGKIYAIGGCNQSDLYPPDLNGGFVGTNEEYDPETDTWTFKASMPTPRDYFAMAVYENKIYCIGGTVDIGHYDPVFSTYINTGANEVYDPATDTWETRTPIPTTRNTIEARRYIEAHVVDGKIHVIGEKVNEVYDPATDTWTSKTPMPDVATHFVSTVFEGKIYVVASHIYTSDEELERHQFVYDAKTDSWSQGTPAPTIIISGTAVATTGIMALKRMYVVGASYVGVYEPNTDSWTAGATTLTNRRDYAAAVVNDTLYTIGGYTFDEPYRGYVTVSALNEQYTPFGYGTPDPSYVPPDTVAPEVSVISPQNGTSYKPDIPLNFTVNEPVSYMRYKLDGETVAEVEGNSTLNGLAAGLHNLTLYVTDVGGNTGASETIYFTVDDTAPLVSVLTPENTTYDVTEVPLNFTVNEEVSGMSYSLDGQETVPITGNTTLSGVPNGLHNITVYGTDETGNTGASDILYFSVKVPELFPTTYVAAAVIVASIIVTSGLIVYLKKRKHQEKINT